MWQISTCGGLASWWNKSESRPVIPLENQTNKSNELDGYISAELSVLLCIV